MTKKMTAVAVVVATVAGVILYYFNSTRNSIIIPTSQPIVTKIDTSKWETFRDENYGYEIKYPNEISSSVLYPKVGIDLCLDQYVNVSEQAKKDIELRLYKNCLISFTVDAQKVDNPNNYSVEEWMLRNRINIMESYSSNPEDEPSPKEKYITIQGEPAFYLARQDIGTGSGMYASTDTGTYILHGGYLYFIHTTLLPKLPVSEWKSHPYYKYLEQSVPITEAIVNSFKFTK